MSEDQHRKALHQAMGDQAYMELLEGLGAVPRQVADAWLDERDAAHDEADRLIRALGKIAHEAVDAPHARQIARAALDAEDGDR